jgi:flagellar hook-associated protein 1 FlgK
LWKLRDIDVRGEIQSLDEMTMAFADLVNGIHRDAWSPGGRHRRKTFFTEYPFVDNLSGNYDRSGDGELDSTYVYRLTGIHTLDPASPVGFAGTITLEGPDGDVKVPYTAMDTVEMVLDRINSSGAEVTARLDRQGRLEIRGRHHRRF